MSQPDHVQIHRERYHQVVPVEVTIAHTANGRKTRTIAKQCAMHATSWAALSETQQEAALHIGRCFRVIAKSPAKAMDYERAQMPRGAGINPEFEQALKAEYFAWWGLCMDDQIDPNPARLVCGEGVYINQMTTSGHRRKLLTEQYHKSLDVMANMKGWR